MVAARRIMALVTGMALGGGGLCWFALPRSGCPPVAACHSGTVVPAIPRDLRSRFRHYATRDASGREVLDPVGLVACVCLLDDAAKERLARVCLDERGVQGWSLHLRERLKRLFALTDTDADKGITYDEFCVLFTLLSTRRKYLRMAFEVFDRNEDRCLSKHEFRHLLNALMVDPAVRIVRGRPATKRPMSSAPATQARDAAGPTPEAAALVKDTFLDSALAMRFFGSDGSRRISFDEFWTHIRDIRSEVRALEFGLYDPENTGYIATHDFRRILYRGMPDDAVTCAGAKDAGAVEEFVSWDFYLKVFDLLYESETIARALDCALRSKPPPPSCAPPRGEGAELLGPPRGASAVEELDSSEFARLLQHSDVASRLSREDVERVVAVLDADGSGKLSPAEFARLCELHTSFFATRLPRFNEPQRNTVQQFVFCMQQL